MLQPAKRCSQRKRLTGKHLQLSTAAAETELNSLSDAASAAGVIHPKFVLPQREELCKQSGISGQLPSAFP